jgi:hypothetical protein
MVQANVKSSDEYTRNLSLPDSTRRSQYRSYQKPDYETTSIAVMTQTGGGNNDDANSNAS